MTIEKIEILGPFWSYQQDSTANPALLPQKMAKWAIWQCCLTGSSETTHMILPFSIVMGAKPSF
jgi:hypothetical protein